MELDVAGVLFKVVVLELLEGLFSPKDNVDVADDVLDIGDEEPAGRQVAAGLPDYLQKLVFCASYVLVLGVHKLHDVQRLAGLGDEDDAGKLEVVKTEKIVVFHLVVVVCVHNDRNEHVEHDCNDHE